MSKTLDYNYKLNAAHLMPLRTVLCNVQKVKSVLHSREIILKQNKTACFLYHMHLFPSNKTWNTTVSLHAAAICPPACPGNYEGQCIGGGNRQLCSCYEPLCCWTSACSDHSCFIVQYSTALTATALQPIPNPEFSALCKRLF